MKCIYKIILALLVCSTVHLGLIMAAEPSGENASDEKPGPPWELGEQLDELGRFFKYEDGFVNLRIEDSSWRLHFTDAERVIIEPRHAVVLLQWEPLNNPRERTRLELRSGGQGVGLGNPRKLTPPHLYRIKMTIPEPGSDRIIHTFPYVVFRQVPQAD